MEMFCFQELWTEQFDALRISSCQKNLLRRQKHTTTRISLKATLINKNSMSNVFSW